MLSSKKLGQSSFTAFFIDIDQIGLIGKLKKKMEELLTSQSTTAVTKVSESHCSPAEPH